MSKEIYLQKLQLLQAIDQLQSPTMPVAIAIQEAADLATWCLEDKKQLTGVGLDWLLVDDLKLRTDALRYIQSEWQKAYQSREDAQKEWANAYPAAYELRDELLHHFFHAFRRNSELSSQTTRISKGSGHADMLQDLSDLSVLGKDNSALLTAIGVDLTLLDNAAAMASQLSDLLSRANGERMTDNVLRISRDRAYTHLKQAVDEIRHHGQYVFWRNEARKKGYVSRYIHKKNQTARTTTSAPSTAPTDNQ